MIITQGHPGLVPGQGFIVRNAGKNSTAPGQAQGDMKVSR